MEFINANDLPAAGAMGTDNKVIVQQGDKFVLMTLAELLEYVASASVNTDPTLTLEGVAAEALATGKAFKAARAVNLLDNSNFKNPVNQRGKAEYHGTTGYTIDRWRVPTKTKVEVLDSYIRLTCTTESTANGFTQYFGAPLSPGTVLTAAMMENDGTLHVGAITVPESNYATAFTLANGCYLRVDKEKVSFMLPGGQTVDVAWIAMYEGEYTADTLPEYQPKGYAAELAECMRYFQKFGGVQVPAVAHSDIAMLISPPCKTTMRSYPTLSGVSLTHLRADGKNITSFPSHTIAAFGTNPGSPNYSLTFASAHGASQFHAGMLYMSGELSADL